MLDELVAPHARRTLTPFAAGAAAPALPRTPPQRTIEMPYPRLDFRSPEYDHSLT
ncbi:hypothetical protein [Burkholderia sola]